jgi:hypothetical protein
MSPVDYATATHKFEPSTINKRPLIATMKLILSVWTIVVWAVIAPEIYASTYKEDKEIENHLMAGGDLFMQKTMLRQKRALSGQSRIVGGNDADTDKYPFFVEWDGCGASLVHKGKQILDDSSAKWRVGLVHGSDLARIFLHTNTDRHNSLSCSLC